MARVESRTVLHAPCRTVRSGCRTSQTDIWMSATKTITLHLHPAIVLICRHSQSDDYRERLVEVISCTDYSSHLLFVIGDLPHIPCSSVASLLYYFGTAGRLWWLILCYTWNYQTTNTGSIILDGVFNLFRDFVLVFACSLPLLFGCFTMLNSPQDQFSAGLVGVLYPVAALFYISPVGNKHGYQPAVPRIPQPTIPVSIRSHNTYASAQRVPIC
uniref:Frizzled domain-containing protein n=1 Tax=Heterorhabditis bacteriophora TaxID=37862 RepID=A0A1I7WXR3_HETBA